MGKTAQAIAQTIDSGVNLAGNIISAGQVRRTRQWKEKMANTAHQRQVADLRAAGLNPVLSAMGGKGAETPAHAPFQFDSKSNIANTAYQIKQMTNQARQVKSLEETNATQQAKNLAEAATAAETAKSIKADVQLKHLQLPKAAAMKKFYEDNPWAIDVEGRGKILPGGMGVLYGAGLRASVDAFNSAKAAKEKTGKWFNQKLKKPKSLWSKGKSLLSKYHKGTKEAISKTKNKLKKYHK